jgi:hypothetical protein
VRGCRDEDSTLRAVRSMRWKLPFLLGCAVTSGKPADDSGAAATDIACAPEVCNGRDDDCNAVVDEDVAGAPTWYTDGDGRVGRGRGW